MKAIPSESNKERVETKMKLTRIEIKSAIVGMVIGDGCLSKHKRTDTNNAYFQMSHCDAQYEYLMWKKGILENVSGCKVWPATHKAPNGKIFKGWHLNSKANPVYTKLYNRFYVYKKKSLDEYLVKMITSLALAIMYMDDGCIGKAMPQYWTKETFYLCLDNFDYANLFLLKKSLKLKFDLDWNINKTSVKYYQLRLLNKHNQKFADIVRPYIELVPSMLYKLGSYASTSEEDVDIVRPV
uniref:Putative homing endonuclease n=1 Tax=viral metagenome TaxID=1070528 RepID=A0A6M3XGD2_9ZZZZ